MSETQGRSRKWVREFFLLLLIGILAYMGVNYYADALGYFTNAKKKEYYFSDDYARAIKLQYLLDHKDEIQGVILGGSKSGTLDVERMEEYTGLRYYNMYMNIGNFSDYLDFTRFLVKKTDVSEITLSLSSFETLGYDQEDRGNVYKKPALVTGGTFARVQEVLANLMLDQKSVVEALESRGKKEPARGDSVHNGMRNRRGNTLSISKDWDGWVNKTVLKRYDRRLAELFSEKAEDQGQVRAQNLEALRQIKELCSANGVTLKVMFPVSFLGERYDYECPSYYAYFAQIVNIAGEVWDFSDYNDVSLNPYNFYDWRHCSRAVNQLTIDTMYGHGSMEGFGRLLTKDNVQAYLQQRQADYMRLKEEYGRTGTVKLHGKGGPGSVKWTADPAWEIGEAIERMNRELGQARAERTAA